MSSSTTQIRLVFAAQSSGIIRLKCKVPETRQEFLRFRFVQGIFGALATDVLHDAWGDGPADLVAVVRKVFRQHVHVSDSPFLVHADQVGHARLREDKGLRTAAKLGHLMHPSRDGPHGDSTGGKVEADEKRRKDSAHHQDQVVWKQGTYLGLVIPRTQ